MPTEATLSIGEVAELVGAPTSTLRYYERRGLAVADARASGQRRYTQSTVRRIVFVHRQSRHRTGCRRISGLSWTPAFAGPPLHGLNIIGGPQRRASKLQKTVSRSRVAT